MGGKQPDFYSILNLQMIRLAHGFEIISLRVESKLMLKILS